MNKGYKRAFLQCLLLFFVGVVLQIFFGDVPRSLVREPWGWIIAINYAYLLVLVYAFSGRVKFFKSLYDQYSSVASLCSMMLMCVIFGLVPQSPEIGGFIGEIGFSRMSSSYPFNLLLIYFITTLGLRAIDDVYHWRNRRFTTLLMHTAIFVALACAVLSSGDKQRVKVVVPIGHSMHNGWSATGESVALPFTIKLNEFSLEYYPPQLALYNIDTENTLGAYIAVDDTQSSVVDGYNIAIEEYIPEAILEADGYVASSQEGSAPAVCVVVETPRGDVRKGWVTVGSYRVEPRAMPVDGSVAVVMLPQEPKHYLSRIEVVEQGGEKRTFDVEVNHPAKVGPWYIYQSGYDTERGRWSKISVFECVRDGWYPIIHYSMWVILIVGAVMFLPLGIDKSRKKK